MPGGVELKPGGVELKLVRIPAGSFIMGSPENELGRSSGEKPHRVTLAKGHGLGETEATQGQYAAVKNGILDWRHPSYFKGHDRLPVENVSWCNAMSFCKKLTELERKAGMLLDGYEYSLPTEAQWEHACRAGTANFDEGIPRRRRGQRKLS